MTVLRSEAGLELMIYAVLMVLVLLSRTRRRQRVIQANVRSTTPRRGITSKPMAASDRLMIWMAASSRSLCKRFFSPASISVSLRR